MRGSPSPASHLTMRGDLSPAGRGEGSRAFGIRFSTTRMPSPVLAAIGGGALLAADGGRAVVIGPGAGEGSRPVIMQVAEPRDVETVDVMVMAVMVPANRIV